MMSKRSFLKGLVTAGFGGLASACSKPRTVKRGTFGDVPFVELVHKQPDPSLPIVVALHGQAGSPENWIDGFTKFPGRARIALPQGFYPMNKLTELYSWWKPEGPNDRPMDDPELAKLVTEAEERLWKGIAALAGTQRVIVCGYTQGAIMSYVLAAKHPETVVAGFALAGACPPSLHPKAKCAPMTAYHGTADDVIPLAVAKASIDAFKAFAPESKLREYAGVKHTANDPMHHDFNEDATKALEAGRR